MFADKLTNVCTSLHLNLITCGASVSISLHREVSGENVPQGTEIISIVSKQHHHCNRIARKARWNALEYFFSFTHPLRSGLSKALTDSKANEPQSCSKMKVNIFMNGSECDALRSIKIMECVTLFPAPQMEAA